MWGATGMALNIIAIAGKTATKENTDPAIRPKQPPANFRIKKRYFTEALKKPANYCHHNK